jgi:hypothetical protein
MLIPRCSTRGVDARGSWRVPKLLTVTSDSAASPNMSSVSLAWLRPPWTEERLRVAEALERLTKMEQSLRVGTSPDRRARADVRGCARKRGAVAASDESRGLVGRERRTPDRNEHPLLRAPLPLLRRAFPAGTDRVHRPDDAETRRLLSPQASCLISARNRQGHSGHQSWLSKRAPDEWECRLSAR